VFQVFSPPGNWKRWGFDRSVTGEVEPIRGGFRILIDQDALEKKRCAIAATDRRQAISSMTIPADFSSARSAGRVSIYLMNSSLKARQALKPEYFDALYAADPAPWNFAASPNEQAKYRLALA
jgi:hypothetical protein